ncbi:MAG: SpoIID/LytB domain-containing protein [Dethiobacter sp.]|jgi:stage II sporulation protein D|nr:MAG: SpoIID/LytB domain-containing protein [Dethiobacter sp.]
MSYFRNYIRKISPFIAAFILLAAFAASCQTRFFRPAEPPFGRRAEPPPIPPEIAAGEREEPVISVYIAERGVVEQMAMEDYIAGVVAGEMDPKWPLPALAAQAIIARTFTLQKIAETGGVPRRNAHASTDIDEFQAYSAEDITDRVREAVRITRGEAACHGGEFIRAWFNAYAGPRTALADEGLAFKTNPPYIRIVESPGQKIVPEDEGTWSASFTLEQVRNAVRQVTGRDPGFVRRVEIAEHGPSGRAAAFLVNNQKISAPGLRLSLGSTVMRSTFVEEMNISGGRLHMSGTGFGHGVGMCQWGARALAEEGRSPEEIVAYFYKDINIISLWD